MKIQNLKKIAATGKVDNQFIGIKIFDNQIEFHYPETYQLSENDDGLRRDILAILRTVSLAKTRTSDVSSFNTQHRNDYVFPLGAYLWIINDYLSYGRYENREKVYQRGARGKIDWKRTMHSNPVISARNIIYTDIISEKKSQKDNLLTEIFFFCVQKATDEIGWLYGISFDPNGVDYYRRFNKKLYLSALNTELAHTFDDQKKVRLQNMKNVIIGLDDDIVSTREMIYGVDSYDYIETKYRPGHTAENGYANAITIENINPMCKEQPSVDGVRVILVAFSPTLTKTVVVGWYDNATVFRNRVVEGDLIYMTKCLHKDAHLIPDVDRSFEIPRAQGNDFGIGQSNFWYLQTKNNTYEFEQQLTEYIDSIKIT